MRRNININYFKLSFRGNNTVALNREYIKGKVLRKKELITDNNQQTFLRKTINNLHKRGVAGLNLGQKANIIISSSGKPFIIDLGTAYFSGQPDYEIAKKKFRIMEMLFENK